MGNQSFRADAGGVLESNKRIGGRLLYSRHDLRLLRQYMAGFPQVVTHSNQSDLNTIRNHWDKLSELHKSIEMFDIFHTFLNELAPQVAPLFKCAKQFKGRALMNLVGGIKTVLQSDNVVERAARIAQRHVTYGVRCEHFNPVGLALLKTLEFLSPPLWTKEICDAWRIVYCHAAIGVLHRLHQEVRSPPLSATRKLWRTSSSIGTLTNEPTKPEPTTTNHPTSSDSLPNSGSSPKNQIKLTVLSSRLSAPSGLRRAKSTSQMQEATTKTSPNTSLAPNTSLQPAADKVARSSPKINSTTPREDTGPDVGDVEDPYTGLKRRDMLQLVPSSSPSRSPKSKKVMDQEPGTPSTNPHKLVRSVSDLSSLAARSSGLIDLYNIECPYTGHKRSEMANLLIKDTAPQKTNAATVTTNANSHPASKVRPPMPLKPSYIERMDISGWASPTSASNR